MAARESAVHKNHNPILKILNYLPLTFFFHNGCLSWPYLWKYWRDWN